MRQARIFIAVLVAGLAVLAGRPAAAQTVTGQLVDREAGVPIEGAFVRLLQLSVGADEGPADSAREVDATFTRADGEFSLQGTEAGRYRLGIERIGYRTVRTDPFRLTRSRTLRKDLVIQPESIRLSDLTVTGERHCDVRLSEARSAGRLWEEVRKALAAAVHGQQRDLLRYTVRSFTHRLDSRLRRQEEVMDGVRTDLGVVPFQSLPGELLSENGYVQRAGEGHDQFYYAPDATVLLSDAFRSNHCFWVTREPVDHPGWVGLAFRPAEGRDVPEIRGVIWVEEASAELRRLEYRYTGYGLDRVTTRAGGVVRFDRVTNGPWIVSDWHILMPLVERRELRAADYVRAPENVLTGYKKVGGQVLEARTPSGETVFRSEASQGG